MNYETQTGPFYKSLMAGLFGGIIVTIANLMYNFIYRGVTRFNPSEVINVTSIIFVSLILSMVAGIIYYMIVSYAHKSKMIYIALFIVLTVVVVYGGFSIQRSTNPNVTAHFHWLLGGIVIITGLTDALLIPYMAKHENIAF
jgi:FtsH-binding integral membrane protein